MLIGLPHKMFSWISVMHFTHCNIFFYLAQSVPSVPTVPSAWTIPPSTPPSATVPTFSAPEWVWPCVEPMASLTRATVSYSWRLANCRDQCLGFTMVAVTCKVIYYIAIIYHVAIETAGGYTHYQIKIQYDI